MSQSWFIEVTCLPNRPEVGLPVETCPFLIISGTRYRESQVLLAVALGWAIDCLHTTGGCSFLNTRWCCVCLSPALWSLFVPHWLVRVLLLALEIASYSFWHLPGECCPCLTLRETRLSSPWSPLPLITPWGWGCFPFSWSLWHEGVNASSSYL